MQPNYGNSKFWKFQIVEIPNCGNSDYQNGWNFENLKQKINDHKRNACFRVTPSWSELTFHHELKLRWSESILIEKRRFWPLTVASSFFYNRCVVFKPQHRQISFSDWTTEKLWKLVAWGCYITSFIVHRLNKYMNFRLTSA